MKINLPSAIMKQKWYSHNTVDQPENTKYPVSGIKYLVGLVFHNWFSRCRANDQ